MNWTSERFLRGNTLQTNGTGTTRHGFAILTALATTLCRGD